MRLRLLVAATAMFAASLPALADTFSFSFGTLADPFSGSGTFTASSISSGEYLITGVSGTANTGGTASRAITSLLAPGTFPTFANGGTVPSNDNDLFYPATGGGYFDGNGVSFELGNGAQINLYFLPFGPNDAFLLRSDGVTTVNENVTESVSQVAAVTPEPSSLLLLSTGMIGAVGMLRRRRAA